MSKFVASFIHSKDFGIEKKLHAEIYRLSIVGFSFLDLLLLQGNISKYHVSTKGLSDFRNKG
jgi:hypothetical protein